MHDNVLNYIAQYISLTEEEIQTFLNLHLIRAYPKGALLLKEGEIARECYFVLRGCLRSYYLVDGEERTTDFFTENDPLTPVSYLTSQPSQYIVACVEDSIVSIGNPEKTALLLQTIPKFEALVHSINNQRLAEKQMGFDDFRNLTAEQRYKKLQETRPDLLQRVPQYMIASFLGMKPESLSRIRNRLAKQK